MFTTPEEVWNSFVPAMYHFETEAWKVFGFDKQGPFMENLSDKSPEVVKLSNQFAGIFEAHCTPGDRKQGRSLWSACDTPDYDPALEHITAVETDKNKAVIYTQKKTPFGPREFSYICHYKADKGWLLNNKKFKTIEGHWEKFIL